MKKRERTSVIICLSLALLLCAGMAAYSAGQTAATGAEYFDGKTINFIVTNEPGSGFDTYTRAVAPYVQENIPGSKIIVTNMDEAGGIIGLNKAYKAEPNGLTICTTSGAGMLFAQLRELPGVQFDLQKMTWLGRVSAEVHVMIVSAKSPFKTWDDVVSYKEPYRFSASGVGSDDYIVVGIIKDALNLPMDQIVGYEEGGEWLAVVKGETWGTQGSWSTTSKFVRTGDAIPVLQTATERHKDLQDIPTIVEVLPEKDKDLGRACASIFAFDRVICGPPGMPEDRVKVLRDALKKAFDNPKYQADLVKLKRPHVPATGEETEEIMMAAFAQADTLAAVLEKLPAVEED